MKGVREGKGAIDRGGEEEDDQPPAFLCAELRKGLKDGRRDERGKCSIVDQVEGWRGRNNGEQMAQPSS